MKNVLLFSFLLSSIISFSQCESFEMEITYNSPTCFGFSDGSVVIMIDDGYDVTYTITDADGIELNEDNSNTANTLVAGWYYLLASGIVEIDGEEYECELEDSVFIDEPGEIDIDLRVMNSYSLPDCDGYAVVDTVYNYTGDYDYISYFWTPNPTGDEGLGADSIYTLCEAEYMVTINDENGCSNTFDFSIEYHFASLNKDKKTEFLIQSNTVTKEVRIEISNYKGPLAIDFFNATGQLVYSNQLNGAQTLLNPQLNAGIYIYAIRQDDQSLKTGKLVFE